MNTFDSLRVECTDIENEIEAENIVQFLESKIPANCYSISAVQFGIPKKAAIIRHPYQHINLINTEVASFGKMFLSLNETCLSIPGYRSNCKRWSSIKIINGVIKHELEFDNKQISVLVQHEIDHFYKVLTLDRMIKFCSINKDGRLYDKQLCPCGSKAKFKNCCKRLNDYFMGLKKHN